MNLLSFQYNLGKDVENFIRGTDAVNNKQLTKLHIEYELSNGKDFQMEKVNELNLSYKNQRGINT